MTWSSACATWSASSSRGFTPASSRPDPAKRTGRGAGRRATSAPSTACAQRRVMCTGTPRSTLSRPMSSSVKVNPMTVTAMSDEAARQEVRTELTRTLFVEAGAGTGKTTVLVDRIVNLVRSGAEMRRIAAITFTEAAATELRDRIREALEKAAKAEGDARLAAAVSEVDEAAISTLH